MSNTTKIAASSKIEPVATIPSKRKGSFYQKKKKIYRKFMYMIPMHLNPGVRDKLQFRHLHPVREVKILLLIQN